MILNNDGKSQIRRKSTFYLIVNWEIMHIFCQNNSLGIVIKYENMTYRTAVHYAHLVLSLYGKASKYIRDLFEHPDVC